MPRNLALGAHFERFIEEQVERGRYGNAAEVIREGLRLPEDRDTHRRRIEEVRRSIEESRESGVLLSEEEVFGSLDARYAARIEENHE